MVALFDEMAGYQKVFAKAEKSVRPIAGAPTAR